MYNLSKSKVARSFWKDLMGTLWGNPETKATHGTMSAEHIAEIMNTEPEWTTHLLWECVKQGLSDRANGQFVV